MRLLSCDLLVRVVEYPSNIFVDHRFLIVTNIVKCYVDYTYYGSSEIFGYDLQNERYICK